MSKQITHIDCPKEFESTNDWDSHRPMLWLAIQKTDGNFIEMGSGEGSTPLLDKICYDSSRKFLSIESTPEKGKTPIYGWSISHDGYLKIKERWPEIFIQFLEPTLFIDCAPGELRADLIKEWMNDAKVIIAHDTEPGAEYVYGMSEILSTFKYRLDYQPEGKPHTTAVSNFINVENFV